MNSYKNNHTMVNSPENSSNTVNRYPYACNPNIETQNMNYKDWMAGYEEIAPSSLSLILSSIGILNQVIALTGVLGKTPEIINIVQEMVSLIRGNTGNDLLVHVEQLIQQTLATQYRSAATGAIYGISRAYNNYLEFFRQWERNRTPQNGQQVESAFTTVNTLCINALAPQASLSRRGFETLLLPNYALAANFHLLLLRDAVLYRTQWLANSISTTNVNIQILTRAINEYRNHCNYWYNNGLNRFTRTSFNDWVRFNAYRRDMTLSVLDFVTVFPTYDPIRYPRPTNVELTRIVYTDPISPPRGFPRTNPPSFNQMENLIISGGPSFLNQLRIYTTFYHDPHHVNRDYWAGNRNYLSNGISRQSGSTTPWPTNIPMQNIDIFRVNLTTHDIDSIQRSYGGVHRSDFIGVNTINNQRTTLFYHQNVDTSRFLTRNETVFLPGDSGLEPNEQNYTHRLFQVMTTYRINPNARRAAFLHAWTHRSLRRRNGFRTDQIMQIPAVKTISTGDDRAVVLNYGENIMKLDNLTSGLSYKVTATDSAASNTRFIVRVRYASMDNNKLNLVLNGAQIASLNVERTVQNGGESLTALQCEDFKYATFAGDFQMGSQSIFGIFKDISNADFILDKIELIPSHFMSSLEQTQDDYSYNQNTIYTCNQGYGTYDHNSSNMYDHQNYKNYTQDMDTTYQPDYDNYNQNNTDIYDSGYNNSQNTGCTCNQGYNNNYPK
uniref:Crystaline entomocidal protoxin n=1 Tax=Bacillus thuringiensis serovar mogi TaxID=1391189 RepID=V9P860_BACTU|nr:insecticidal protein Cry20Bb1 [Bacillus thuringiensis serovar mogi]